MDDLSETKILLLLLDMDKTFADNLCIDLQHHLTSCVWASYDMINPDDSFGKMMALNLRDAGFHVPGFKDFPSLESQEARFCAAAEWRASASCTMARAHDLVLSAEERAAADKIERLDELEEWELLMMHYCITIATNDKTFSYLVRLFPSSIKAASGNSY